MNKRPYPVLVKLTRDQLSDDSTGYMAEIPQGHPKVRHLYAFGTTRVIALTSLASAVATALDNSRYNLAVIDSIVMIVLDVHTYPLADLGFRDKPDGKHE